MPVVRHDTLPLHTDQDVVLARQAVRARSTELKFSIVDQTKLVTAASELARNTVVHGKGGAVLIEVLHEGGRHGIRLTFEDHGPGIPDIDLALQDGYTTGSGMGLGLGGARRLVNEFAITSRSGEGTRVVVIRWK